MPPLAKQIFRRLAADRSGNTMIEYGIAAALMAAAIVSFISDLDDPEGLLGRIKLLVDGVLA